MASGATPTRVHRVVVEPSGVVLEAMDGETIMAAAQRCGYRWPTLCHGEGTCSVCWVEVTAGEARLSEVGHTERETLETLVAGRGAPGRIRLACRARVNGDATVRKNGVRPDAAGGPTIDRATAP